MAHSSSRRALLGAFASLPVAVIAAPAAAAGADAPLIALCAEFDRVESQMKTLADEDFDSAECVLTERQRAIFDQIDAMPARTLMGMLARLRTFLRWSPDRLSAEASDERGLDDRFLLALHRDMEALQIG